MCVSRAKNGPAEREREFYNTLLNEKPHTISAIKCRTMDFVLNKNSHGGCFFLLSFVRSSASIWMAMSERRICAWRTKNRLLISPSRIIPACFNGCFSLHVFLSSVLFFYLVVFLLLFISNIFFVLFFDSFFLCSFLFSFFNGNFFFISFSYSSVLMALSMHCKLCIEVVAALIVISFFRFHCCNFYPLVHFA